MNTDKGIGIDYMMEYMGLAIIIIVAIMILLAVAMFIIGLVQKAKRRNDGLAQKSKLLEMYAAEEKERQEQEKLKEVQKNQSEE